MDSTSLDPRGSDEVEVDEQHTLDASFAVLELCLQRLARIAPVAAPAELLELIPQLPPAAQQLILCELIKFDMNACAASQEALPAAPPPALADSAPDNPTVNKLPLDNSELSHRTWEQGTTRVPPRRLDFYWPAVEGLLPLAQIPLDLVLEEVQLRRAAGEHPKWDDYRQRFPDLAATIGQWFAGGQADQPPSQAPSGAVANLPELPVDSVIDDFHLLKLLGQGAFARVYLAQQLSMQRLVALKVSSRGTDEPRALSQLDHANIVRVYDQRELAQPTVVLLYMQYLAGGTLADCIRLSRDLPMEARNGSLLLTSIDRSLLEAHQSVPEGSTTRAQLAAMPWPKMVAWIGVQLAQGLGYATRKDVLHRDVKPANILLSGEGVPKLADFNVSCTGLSGRAGAAAYFGGSLAYMSPEQLRVADPTDPLTAERLDGRSDLYALGIVLWELWQGRRPWTTTELASGWIQAVQLQSRLRLSEITPLRASQTPTERVLEKTLRSLLQVDPAARPQSGEEAAARMRLALHPEMAARFQPAPGSLSGWLLRIPVLLLSALIIFGPNTAASIFNYDYNRRRMQELKDVVPNIIGDFEFLAQWVNGVVFPLGAILFLIIMLPIVRIMLRAKQGKGADQAEISQLWNIGNKATLICGVLWAVSGLVFAITFSSMHAEFSGEDALHFFLSLILCGGVAWIYPYFGMTLLALLVYYPTVIEPSMHDPHFAQRCEKVRRHSRWYLLSAAAIPLTAVGALVFRKDLPGDLILGGVCITALGLIASFFAQQKLDESLRQYEKVLGSDESWRPDMPNQAQP